MVKKTGAATPRAEADQEADTEHDSDHLPTTNGSQHELHSFLHDVDYSSQCLSPEEVYYLSLGASLTSVVK